MNYARRKRIRKQDLELMDADGYDGVQDILCPYCGTLAARVNRFLDGTGTIEIRCWYCMGIVSEDFGGDLPRCKRLYRRLNNSTKSLFSQKSHI